MNLRLYLLAFLLGGLLGCGSGPSDAPASAEEELIPFRRDGQVSFFQGNEKQLSIDVEIAATDSARARGLMQRASLPDSSGMLFLFPQTERSGFWMANTPLSLDIIFINADSQIVDIAKYTRPLSSKNIPSQAPYRYVVEVPAGFADTHGLVEGSRISWTQ